MWKSVWPIPTAFTLVGLCYTGNDFELRGVGLAELLGRMAIFAGALLSCLTLFRMIQQAEARIRAKEEAEKSRLLLKLQGKQYQALTRHIESARRARHDLRQHLTVISAMAAQGDCEAVQSYAAHLTPTEAAPLTLCEHPACNALLSHYQTLAQSEGVTVDTQANIPQALQMEESDLAVVLGNLLEHALEANRYVPQAKRRISVRAKTQGARLFLIVSNPCDGQERSDNGKRSRKRAYGEPGVGLSSVEAVVQRYHGDLKIDRQDERFTVSVMLKEN